jgi:phosphoglycerate kinase
VLPTDVVVAPALAPNAPTQTVPVSQIPPDQMGLDIGAETARAFGAIVRTARTVVWNGPLGAFETPPFEQGTRAVLSALAEIGRGLNTWAGATRQPPPSNSASLTEITHISTGGGASLEFLEGRDSARRRRAAWMPECGAKNPNS